MIQRHAELVGKYGCYFICIVHLAEIQTGQRIDILKAYEEVVNAGYMKTDCFVNDAGRILSYLTGANWRHYHEPMSYRVKSGELEIVRYERKTTMETVAHFVIGDLSGGCFWDPYGVSETVEKGSPVSKRIFRRVL